MRTTDTRLPGALTGLIVAPGDESWVAARRAFNLVVDQRPAAVAFPAHERDVVAIVDHARRNGLRVASQSTGHGAGSLAPLDDTIVVNVSRLAGVSIDPSGRRVRVGGGVRWERVTPRLSELGLAALHGSSPGVGITGYSLAGGMGWLARKHGLQATSVTAVELVTAEGHLVRADAVHEPDLFWALRGGGGGFGVVTAIEFAVHPVSELYAGVLSFPFERAAEVLHTWTDMLPALPDELTSWASLLHLPDAPHVPPVLRGRSVTVVSGAFLGGEAEGRELLRPLWELGPDADTFAVVPPRALAGLAMDPPAPLPYRSAHRLLRELPAAGVDGLVAAAGPGSGSALTKVQLRHTGGALGRRVPGAGALAALPGTLSAFSLGAVADEASSAAVAASLAAVQAALEPHDAGAYAGFVDEPAEAGRFFDRETWTRLREVKALYDPRDLFTGSHHIPPADGGARSHVPARDARRPPRSEHARAAAGGASPAAGGELGVSTAPIAGGAVARSAVVRSVEDLRWTPAVVLFEGRWDGIETSVYVTTFEEGRGPRLHLHPYPEVFLVQDGVARFDVDGEAREVGAGHVVVVAPGTPHRYENIGADPLTVVSVHPSGVVVQTNL